ncbi:MAG: hypothetical protein COA84_10815 [Robiginitomaculum sp.]|nr:MAG: hypothetical protein COA84_10815 [Robiginitomaculum sp.]
MNRRMILLLSAVGVLGSLFALDRFVLNPSGSDNLAAPVRRAERQRQAPKSLSRAQIKDTLFLSPLGTYGEVWQRPVFTPSRQPAPGQTRSVTRAEDNSADDQPPDFNIIGVATGPQNSAALIRTGKRSLKRYYMGEEINGWTIDEIRQDSITVSKNGESWQLPVGGAN